VEIADESKKHAGHGARGGHFILKVASPLFEGKSLLERHRMVYAALENEIASEAIHALSLKTLTPSEWNSGHAKAGNSK
jgi:BolA protein